MLGAVEVHCSNCGSSPVLAWGGIVIAAAALIVALIALNVTRRQLTIDERQHEEFMRIQGARASFDLTLRFPQADDDGVLYTDGAEGVSVLLEIGLKNTGTKRARSTLLNVVCPPHAAAKWCGPTGEDIEESRRRAAPTSERLIDGDGRDLECEYLSLVLPEVGIKPHYVKHVRFMGRVPKSGDGTLPFRVSAQADELDVEEVSETAMFRARQGRDLGSGN